MQKNWKVGRWICRGSLVDIRRSGSHEAARCDECGRHNCATKPDRTHTYVQMDDDSKTSWSGRENHSSVEMEPFTSEGSPRCHGNEPCNFFIEAPCDVQKAVLLQTPGWFVAQSKGTGTATRLSLQNDKLCRLSLKNFNRLHALMSCCWRHAAKLTSANFSC